MKKSDKTTLRSELSSLAKSTAEADALVSLADKISSLGSSQQLSETRHKALLREIKDEIADTHNSWLQSKRLWVGFGASFAALLILFVSSRSSLPGQKLYSLKTISEKTRFAVSFTSYGKAVACSSHLRERAEELAALSGSAVSDGLVQEISGRIIEEAREYTDYAKDSGSSSSELIERRNTDIAYVSDILKTLPQDTLSSEGYRIIFETLSQLEDIAQNS